MDELIIWFVPVSSHQTLNVIWLSLTKSYMSSPSSSSFFLSFFFFSFPSASSSAPGLMVTLAVFAMREGRSSTFLGPMTPAFFTKFGIWSFSVILPGFPLPSEEMSMDFKSASTMAFPSSMSPGSSHHSMEHIPISSSFRKLFLPYTSIRIGWTLSVCLLNLGG